MTIHSTILTSLTAVLLLLPANASADGNSRDGLTATSDIRYLQGYDHALRIMDATMYARSGEMFSELQRRYGRTDAEGCAVLSDVVMNVPGYEWRMNRFLKDEPQSVLVPQIRFCHALNLFDEGRYKASYAILDDLTVKQIYKSMRCEYLFRKAYCCLENGESAKAVELFEEVEKYPMSDFTAPSRYSLGYLHYTAKEFAQALDWFGKAAKDGRFADISNYYMVECHFMLQDYEYVTVEGTKMYPNIPDDRKPHLSRIISESYLVLGDAENAKKFYSLHAEAGGKPKSRADWFYSGSVLYAVQDYRGAIDNFCRMGARTDSIGQVASYHLGYSYIKTKNKVAALDAFKDASMLHYDEDIAQDAYFNYAKLAFDLNSDTSVFREYLRAYPDVADSDRINAYIAVAALYNHDYEGAVEAYDKIDDLDDGMKSNYMKANYLRAEQLISSGSYRKAIPCLRTAAFFSDKGSRFNQLTRFWLAESYYRNDQYAQAADIFIDLYNRSALRGMPESCLIPFNIAYCRYKQEDYRGAVKWFSDYLEEPVVLFRKEALVRMADCSFISKDYASALDTYNKVLEGYFNVNDIYPYYQAALSYGLTNKPDRKIELLSNVIEASPEAEFYPEALFELGRSYAVREDDENAFRCFNKVAEVVKDSTFVAKAYIEMGSLARNQSQYNEALGYYKTVVEQMPLSGCAEDALLAIESIYQTRNTPEEYIAYIESIGKGATKTADEKEDMIFNSAEQIFLSENYQKALVSLAGYTEKYPDGKYVYRADFYMAESYRKLGKSEQACDYYRKVIEGGEGSFVELSMLNFAKLSYSLERWEDAFGGYLSLYGAAQLENNRFEAVKGMMRSAYRGHNITEAVKNSDRILEDSRSDDALKDEARYVKAKSYLASSRRDEAFAIMETLSKDMRSEYGAEAAYLIILDCYDSGRFEDVENKVFAFSDSGTPQTYWLAKSFITLGDSYVERDELRQAKATFESVRDGYSPSGASDDVLDNVNMRLSKLESLMSQEQQ
ncbi:MAG: tetratricopeptide repeat protein [Candidatus Cryptobacteroides sp.]